jgi:hypothetical protein
METHPLWLDALRHLKLCRSAKHSREARNPRGMNEPSVWLLAQAKALRREIRRIRGAQRDSPGWGDVRVFPWELGILPVPPTPSPAPTPYARSVLSAPPTTTPNSPAEIQVSGLSNPAEIRSCIPTTARSWWGLWKSPPFWGDSEEERFQLNFWFLLCACSLGDSPCCRCHPFLGLSFPINGVKLESRL